jgi:hypothetical protein
MKYQVFNQYGRPLGDGETLAQAKEKARGGRSVNPDGFMKNPRTRLFDTP